MNIVLLQNYNEEHEYKDIAINNNRNINIDDVNNNEDKNSNNNTDSNYKKNIFIILISLIQSDYINYYVVNRRSK